MAFFVSWHGVLTLAYSGFPPALAALKQRINETVGGLAAEYAGSKWPKTSLGALHDKARLTPEQLDRLNAICREENTKLSLEADDQAVLVDKLTVVFYECRSLERRLLSHVVPMQPAASLLDARPPEASEQERVRGVVSESDSPDYWFLASKDGSREAHYRNSYLGVTLIHDLAACRQDPSGTVVDTEGSAPVPSFGSRLPAVIAAFRDRVDQELPGLYRWFQDTSLHSTVRSLMG